MGKIVEDGKGADSHREAVSNPWRCLHCKDRIREALMALNLKGVSGCSEGERKKLEIRGWVKNGDRGSWSGKKRVLAAHHSVTQKLVGADSMKTEASISL